MPQSSSHGAQAGYGGEPAGEKILYRIGGGLGLFDILLRGLEFRLETLQRGNLGRDAVVLRLDDLGLAADAHEHERKRCDQKRRRRRNHGYLGLLGAGRNTKEDRIDPAAGILLKAKTGDRIDRGEPLAFLFADSEERLDAAEAKFLQSTRIGDAAPEKRPLILDIVR